MTARTVPLSELRLPDDETVIPRLRENPWLVSEYTAAFKLYGGWGDFPELLVDPDLLVVDGVSRTLAAGRAKLAEAPVIVREFASPAEMLLAAAAANAVHGMRWSRGDEARLWLLAERYQVTAEELAGALRVPVGRVERTPVVAVRRGGGQANAREYVKRSVRSAVKGRVLSAAEAQAMRGLTTPNSADAVVRDILRLAELDALPPLTAESAREVERLVEVLAGWLARDREALVA